MVHQRGGLLDDRLGADNPAGHEIVADAEVLERPLSLSSPTRFARGCRAQIESQSSLIRSRARGPLAQRGDLAVFAVSRTVSFPFGHVEISARIAREVRF